MVADEPLNGQSVVLVVLLVQPDGFFFAHAEVLCKVLIYQVCHEVMDFGAYNPGQYTMAESRTRFRCKLTLGI